jgi:hypothetical protein
MVEAKIMGQSTSAIARAEGLSRDWAAKELQTGESRQILAALVDSNMQRIAAIYAAVLDTIEAGMRAEKTALYLGGAVSMGPDHYARLTAAKRFLELVTMGRPTPRAPDEGHAQKTITLEELEKLVASKAAVN